MAILGMLTCGERCDGAGIRPAVQLCAQVRYVVRCGCVVR